MAERGKSEGAQPGAASEPGSPLTLEEVAAHINEAAARLEEAAGQVMLHYRIENMGVDPADVRLVLVAQGGEGKSAVASAIAERLRNVEHEAPVELDDTYYDELCRAVGPGAPSVLFGTSTRSIRQNLKRLRAMEQGELAPPTPVTRSVRRRVVSLLIGTSDWSWFKALELFVSGAIGIVIGLLLIRSWWLGLAVGIPTFFVYWLVFRILCDRRDFYKDAQPRSSRSSEGKGD